nr:hypothetical protein [uncultured Allomuricauda sp.]
MLSEQQLVEIEKRCNSGTKGPWKAYIEGENHTSGSHFIMTGIDNERGEDLEIDGALIEDYIFIANAKQDVIQLIQEIRRLKALVGE